MDESARNVSAYIGERCPVEDLFPQLDWQIRRGILPISAAPGDIEVAHVEE